MGKEDIGLIYTAISIYKTIDQSYFYSPNNGYILEALLSTEDYEANSLYNSGKLFFQDMFDTYICTSNILLDLDTLRRKLYLLENLIFSIKAVLINNLEKEVFTSDDIKLFYTESETLVSNLKYLILHIELKEQTFNATEFNRLDSIQTSFRNYILDNFWSRFFVCLSSNPLYEDLHKIEKIHELITPVIINNTTTNYSTLERFTIEIDTTYDKKKTTYFDQVDYNSLFFQDMKSRLKSKKVYLYLYKDLNCLQEITTPNYTHNMIGYQSSNNNAFSVNQSEKLFHIKYHSNQVKEAYNIYIHSYYKNNNKKVLVGFAFDSKDQLKTSIPLFRNIFPSLIIQGTIRETFSVHGHLKGDVEWSNILYQWKQSKEVDNHSEFEDMTDYTTSTITVPEIKNYYIKVTLSAVDVNGKEFKLESKPYKVN